MTPPPVLPAGLKRDAGRASMHPLQHRRAASRGGEWFLGRLWVVFLGGCCGGLVVGLCQFDVVTDVILYLGFVSIGFYWFQMV